MNNKGMKAVLIIMIITIAFSTISSAMTNDLGTPIQQSIKKNIDNGNLTPSITPEFDIQVLEKDNKHLKIISKTKITFKNAKEAGYKDNIWPKFKSNGTEFDQKIKDNISANIKNSNNVKLLDQWNNYNFDSGERTFVFNEIYELNYTDINKTKINKYLPQSATIGDILMGFTDEYASGSYSWSEDLYIWIFHVAHIDAGTSMNGAVGLRLPIKTALNTPDRMFIGQIYYPSTSLHGLDWNADNYLNANVPPENGNEFVLRFDIYLWANGWITGIGGFSWDADVPIDESRSFQTPFGPDQSFPISPINLPPDLTGLKIGVDNLAWIGTGLLITPLLGSTDITAGWLARGTATGQGTIDYNVPDIPYSFGPVKAGNSPGWANIKLSDYKYYFSMCQIDLGANLQIGGSLLPNLGTDYYTIYTFDCSAITGSLYLGTHPSTTADSVHKDILVEPSITVTTPNGGDVWPRGTTKAIKWSHSGSNANVIIELWKGGSYYKTITSSTANDGYYSWNIPWITIGSDYKIKITDTTNPKNTDTSNNNFKIAGIRVNSPNGGESWTKSSTHAIKWSYVGSPGPNVKIELWKGGSYYKTINSSTANDGYYSWKVPYVTTASDYKIKIISTSNSIYWDKSDNNFRIY